MSLITGIFLDQEPCLMGSMDCDSRITADELEARNGKYLIYRKSAILQREYPNSSARMAGNYLNFSDLSGATLIGVFKVGDKNIHPSIIQNRECTIGTIRSPDF